MDWRELSETFARWLETNQKVKGRRTGNRIDGHCPLPSHNDKRPSFSYYIEGAGWKCSCGKGKASDLIKDLGLDFGVRIEDLKPIVISEYDYKDESGKLLYQVQRFMPKDFRPRVPKGGDWLTGQGCMNGVRRVLYRLPELLALEQGSTILVVDGEKDANTAWKLGQPATCCAGGMGTWGEFIGAALKGYKVVVVADKDPDQKGRKDAAKVAAALKPFDINAAIIEMPGPVPQIKDLTDWHLAGGTADELKAIVGQEPGWKELTGSPIVSAIDLKDLIDAEVEYTIKPLAPKGALTLLQGRPKSGKSVFALYTGLCASIGIWTAGLFEIRRPLNVLLVEYEDAPLLIMKRLSRYAKGLGLDAYSIPPNFLMCDYPELWLDGEKHKQLLIDEIKRRSLDLVIIDTLSYVHNADDENGSADMKVVMGNLKRIAKESGVSIILIHHTKKGSQESSVTEKARGSSAIAAAADVILDWGDRKKTNTTPVELVSKYDDGLDFKVNYVPRNDDGAVEWNLELGDEVDPDAKKKEMMAALDTLSVTAPNGVAIKTVVGALPKWSERTVYHYISLLEKDEKVSVGRGKGPSKLVKPIR